MPARESLAGNKISGSDAPARGLRTTSDDEGKLIEWIESTLDGKVERCERQKRWRPAWFVNVRRDGQTIPLYVRGWRNEAFPPWPLEYEAGVLTRLAAGGIPVPKIYGMSKEPYAIVMDRARGRHNLETATDEAERIKVLVHLAEIMAAMHQLPIEPFVEMGMYCPQPGSDTALNVYRYCEADYLKAKQRPDPRMEFVRKWIRLNTPTKTTDPRLLHADSGQFMFDNGRITAMLDFEFAVLGDPIHDLAALRSRAIGQPMGDLRPLFDRYRVLTGTKISRELLGFYSVSWRIVTALNTANSLVTPRNRSDHYLEYICRYISSLLNTLRDIAEIENISLEEPAAISDSPSRWALSFSLYEDRLDELGKSAPSQEEKYQLFRTKAFVTFTSRRNQH